MISVGLVLQVLMYAVFTLFTLAVGLHGVMIMCRCISDKVRMVYSRWKNAGMELRKTIELNGLKLVGYPTMRIFNDMCYVCRIPFKTGKKKGISVRLWTLDSRALHIGLCQKKPYLPLSSQMQDATSPACGSVVSPARRPVVSPARRPVVSLSRRPAPSHARRPVVSPARKSVVSPTCRPAPSRARRLPGCSACRLPGCLVCRPPACAARRPPVQPAGSPPVLPVAPPPFQPAAPLPFQPADSLDK